MKYNYCDQLTFIKLKKRLHQFGQLDFRICSDSMCPLIEVGKKIIVAPLDEPLHPFRIIVFWTGKRLIAHYVWHENRINIFKRKTILTRSLKRPYESDLPIDVENILGVVSNYKISLLSKFFISFRCILKGAL
ncbi:MAG: S24/S26 family peptidase [Bacteriovoracaceae bacterium]|nr:S24/S26 family peptidase [Bacteriovoracaceae bacterium]